MTGLTGRRLALLGVLVTVGLLTIGGVAGFADNGVADQPTGEEILDRTHERYDDAETVVGSATVTVANDTDSKTATVDFAAAESNKMWIQAEWDDATYEAGSNGSVVWYAGENRSFGREIPEHPDEMYESEMYGPDDGLSGMNATAGHEYPETNVTATLIETTDLNDESAYVLDLEPTNESVDAPETTLWVATDDYQVLQFRTDDGTNRTELTVTDTQFDVSIDDSQFDPPSDRVEVTSTETYDTFEAAQSSTSLSLPQYDDGTFLEARHITQSSGEAILQQYDTNDGNVTLVTATGATNYLDRLDNGTTVEIDGDDATAVERDDRAVVYWTADGVTTAVVVEGETEDAVDIARDL